MYKLCLLILCKEGIFNQKWADTGKSVVRAFIAADVFAKMTSVSAEILLSPLNSFLETDGKVVTLILAGHADKDSFTLGCLETNLTFTTNMSTPPVVTSAKMDAAMEYKILIFLLINKI